VQIVGRGRREPSREARKPPGRTSGLASDTELGGAAAGAAGAGGGGAGAAGAAAAGAGAAGAAAAGAAAAGVAAAGAAAAGAGGVAAAGAAGVAAAAAAPISTLSPALPDPMAGVYMSERVAKDRTMGAAEGEALNSAELETGDATTGAD
jgi:hypothetical protein